MVFVIYIRNVLESKAKHYIMLIACLHSPHTHTQNIILTSIFTVGDVNVAKPK